VAVPALSLLFDPAVSVPGLAHQLHRIQHGEEVGDMIEGVSHIAVDEFEGRDRLGGEFADHQVLVEKDGAQFGAQQQFVQLGQFDDLALVLGVDRIEFLVDRLQLFIGGLQLLHRGLQVLAGELQLLLQILNALSGLLVEVIGLDRLVIR
jgi:hypothetical protein